MPQAARNGHALSLATAAAAAAAAPDPAAAAATTLLPLEAASASLAEEAARAGHEPPETLAWHFEERLYERVAAGGGASFCHWSSVELPLRAQSVDAVVVDLPFGQTHKMKGGGARTLYPRATREVARVLRPGGRFVALTPARHALTDCLEQQPGLWAECEAIQVNCGGILAWVCVWRRSEAPLLWASASSVPKSTTKKSRDADGRAASDAARTSTDAFFYWARKVGYDMSVDRAQTRSAAVSVD